MSDTPKFLDDEAVSLGGGCYISGQYANRLAQMADDAFNDTRPLLSLKGMSPEVRQLALTTWPAPYNLNLGEMTEDEMFAHLAMVSDYNMAREASGIEARSATDPKGESPPGRP